MDEGDWEWFMYYPKVIFFVFEASGVVVGKDGEGGKIGGKGRGGKEGEVFEFEDD